ncbi:MAG TPA: PIN domain-containing protein [Steroidobacteraceae bacterium]|nr:PIN domain-containing protein [Steroidobacteraceae bacterium]
MNVAELFFDTNVLLYLVSADARKADIAEDLVAAGGHVSVQVLNEFTNVARKKAKLSWDEIADVLGLLGQVCEVHPLLVETHDRGRAIAERHTLSFDDALIVAAAELAGCTRLLSEDLQTGQRFQRGLRVENPFLR